MVDEATRRQLNQLVFTFLGTTPAVAAIDALLGHGQAARIRVFDRPFFAAEWVVGQALQDATPDRFCALVDLVDAAGSIPALSALVAELRAGKVDWGTRQRDPLVVQDDSPFVDRAAVRDVIRAMFTPAATVGCLVVNGGIGEGKSYLRDWCVKIAPLAADARLATCVVPASGAAHADPGTLANKLASDLGLNIRKGPRQHEDLERWAADLASWIGRSVVASGIVTVLLFDGLQHAQIPGASQVFVRALLAARQRDPALANVLRVVMLGYDRLELEREGIAHEAHVLEFVDQGMVKDWYARRHPGRDEWRYDDASAEVIERIPKDGPLRMQNLCLWTREISKDFDS